MLTLNCCKQHSSRPVVGYSQYLTQL